MSEEDDERCPRCDRAECNIGRVGLNSPETKGDTRCFSLVVDWRRRALNAERERAEARSRTDEYIRLNVALGARVERMEAWIKEQGHKNHACFERVDGEVVRHRSGRCECGYDAALAP